MRLKPLEKEVQKAILDYLQLRGFFCWRNNTGGMFWKNNQGKEHYMRFGAVGSGDILGLTKAGKFFSIEVKAPGKYPTPEQKAWMERVNANGGLGFLARSVDDVEKML